MDWLTLFIKLAPVIVQAGNDAAPLVKQLIASIRGGKGEGPTQEQLAELTALETRLRDELHQPVPDDEPKPVIVHRDNFDEQ